MWRHVDGRNWPKELLNNFLFTFQICKQILKNWSSFPTLQAFIRLLNFRPMKFFAFVEIEKLSLSIRKGFLCFFFIDPLYLVKNILYSKVCIHTNDCEVCMIPAMSMSLCPCHVTMPMFYVLCPGPYFHLLMSMSLSPCSYVHAFMSMPLCPCPMSSIFVLLVI